MALEKFTWQNGTQIEPAKVEIGGQSYNVSDAQYEGETPLSAANLNLMQDTLLGNVKDNLNDDTKIPSVKAVKGKILWTNPNPNNTIPNPVDISLSNSDYDVIEVFYKISNDGGDLESAKTIKGHNLNMSASGYQGAGLRRRLAYNSDTSYTISSYNGETLSDSGTGKYIIPIYIIGYNTGLF